MEKKNLDAIVSSLKSAKTPEDIFGEMVGDKLRGLATNYRKLMAAAGRDDAAELEMEEQANLLLAEITAWRDLAESKIRTGTYGDNSIQYSRPRRAEPRTNVPSADYTQRKSDAWTLHEELDAVLFELVGKAKYRPLHIPVVAI